MRASMVAGWGGVTGCPPLHSDYVPVTLPAPLHVYALFRPSTILFPFKGGTCACAEPSHSQSRGSGPAGGTLCIRPTWATKSISKACE